MEIAFGGAAVAAEHHGYFAFLTEQVREGDAVRYAEHGTEVADHTDDMVLVGAEVEAALTAFGETAFFALPLGEEFREGNAARGEHAQVAVQWQDVFIGMQGFGYADRDGFLPDAAEPFTHFSLPEQDEHFLLNDPGFHQGTIQVQEGFIAQVSALEIHAAAKLSRAAERTASVQTNPNSDVFNQLLVHMLVRPAVFIGRKAAVAFLQKVVEIGVFAEGAGVAFGIAARFTMPAQ